MAERTQVTELVQVGVETVLGTPVAATKRLPSLKLSVGLDGSFTEVIPSGYKYPTQEVIGKEWTTAGLEGSPTFDELTYLFASLVNKPTPTANGDGSHTWVFEPSTSSEDTIASYTFEQGSTVRAHEFSGCILTEMSLNGNRDEVGLGGSFMGQLLTDGSALTGSTTSVPQVPLFPKDFTVYADATAAALGTTKLGRVFNWEWSISNVRGPLWVVDAAAESWIVPVELVVDSSLTLTVEANAEGMAYLDDMRSATSTFIRIECISSEADAGTTPTPYSFTLDFAGQINEMPSEFSDEDGVVAIAWSFKNVHDATWDKPFEINLVNATSAL